MKGKIFNAQEVQSILSGNKTMFREVIKKPKHETLQDCIYKGQLKAKGFQVYFENPKTRWLGEDMPTGITIKCPYQVGQKIFCKERFSLSQYLGDNSVRYWASGESELKGWIKPKPAQYMKQEHSRLTLLIKKIRVERLQDISCADYFAETGRRPSITHADLDCGSPDPRNDFKDYWDATHKKPEEKWEANPWVWCVSFEVVK